MRIFQSPWYHCSHPRHGVATTWQAVKRIPVNTTNLDCLLAFTATIVQWVLENIWGGRQADFETSIYCPYYIAALHSIKEERHMNTISAQCLNATTHHIIQRGKDLVNISSSHSGM